MRLGLMIAAALLTATAGFAQATSTFNGRVLDQGDAVLPGVTVTATNTSTGVARTTVTNADGQYSMPGLEPGTYEIKTDLVGFAPSVRRNVSLTINATLTVDFKLALAGVNETLTVTGEAPLIQATQSKVANTIETKELQNLPMISRTISGMLELLPGAAPVAALHRTKETVGSVSYGGSSGGNVIPTVDGADNRDNHYSGPLMSFTTESLEQFQLASNQFSAADGRSSGAAISLVTKSGTNQLHGTVFGYERDRKLTSKDYFTQPANAAKTPFGRQQSGGSVGGPISRNKMFFFGAVEQQQEHQGIFIPQDLYAQLDALVPLLVPRPRRGDLNCLPRIGSCDLTLWMKDSSSRPRFPGLCLSATDRQFLAAQTRDGRAVSARSWKRIRILELLHKHWSLADVAAAIGTYPREVRRVGWRYLD